MNRADFHKLYTYSDNCWRILAEVISTAPEAWNVPFQTTSKWNTVRLLLAHSIAAEERSVTIRLRNLVVPVPYEERAADSWAELYADHQTIRAATRAYLASLSDTEIEGEEIAVPAMNGCGPLTRSDVLFHIINHENYHRGEVITALQRQGIDPPNFDYVLLK